MLQKDKDGFYTAVLDKNEEPCYAGPHTFYKLEERLPLDEALLHADAYAEDETHWLAVWHSRLKGRPFALRPGDIVRFRIRRISPPEDFGHAANARDITVNSDITLLGNVGG